MPSSNLGQFRLARTLQEIAKGERQIEVARQLLVEEPGYSPCKLFKLIDVDCRGVVTGGALKRFLRKHNVYVNDEDVYSLIRRYGNCSPLNYPTFMQSLEPIQSITPRTKNTTKNTKSALGIPPNGKAVSIEERLMVYKMKTEVSVERTLKVMKELLAEDPGHSLRDAFRQADSNRSGYLTRPQIDAVLRQNDVFLTNRELVALLHKMDKDKDGRISYLDFLEELIPLSPSKPKSLHRSTRADSSSPPHMDKRRAGYDCVSPHSRVETAQKTTQSQSQSESNSKSKVAAEHQSIRQTATKTAEEFIRSPKLAVGGLGMTRIPTKRPKTPTESPPPRPTVPKYDFKDPITGSSPNIHLYGVEPAPRRSPGCQRRPPSTAYSHRSPATAALNKAPLRALNSDFGGAGDAMPMNSTTSKAEFSKEVKGGRQKAVSKPQNGSEKVASAAQVERSSHTSFTYSAHPCTPSKREEERRLSFASALFNKLDLNRDGFIDREEFRQAFSPDTAAAKDPCYTATPTTATRTTAHTTLDIKDTTARTSSTTKVAAPAEPIRTPPSVRHTRLQNLHQGPAVLYSSATASNSSITRRRARFEDKGERNTSTPKYDGLKIEDLSITPAKQFELGVTAAERNKFKSYSEPSARLKANYATPGLACDGSATQMGITATMSQLYTTRLSDLNGLKKHLRFAGSPK
mmetsp:Transcript_16959/g.30388  ORF Transcript_16959/g.30388 Transcript_16959/m.30388 type:complete len:689 (-) Transcript_16959:112-2178(-)|eukprot:CAMPEP_0197527502 /NCGR_PEP_ID=MMETSP1318-20131121/21893_1 /TAXON_ID=552666 /ORGANISM="Partenskyella glossopodia, Strain RCC365" /LENGTH=688 /DNA_ID=CAMNT_0043082195 /DNA_START=22 /DNA_END=2088 /DNA_ORIENTATION=-